MATKTVDVAISSETSKKSKALLLIAFGIWIVVAIAVFPTTAEALRLDFGLPGGGRVSYRDGLLRIRPPKEPVSSSSARSDPETFEVPWDRATKREPNISIENRKTTSKGYGAFYVGNESLPVGSFLGFYEGTLLNSREDLDDLHMRRKKDLQDAKQEDAACKVGDYVLSLDGGVHFLDGFDLRFTGGTSSNNNDDDDDNSSSQQPFTPAHLNHADKGDLACNVVRKIVYLPDDLNLGIENENKNENERKNTEQQPPHWLRDDYPRKLPRVPFFAAREISTGEELAFDYGTNFWKRTERGG